MKRTLLGLGGAVLGILAFILGYLGIAGMHILSTMIEVNSGDPISLEFIRACAITGFVDLILVMSALTLGLLAATSLASAFRKPT